MGHRVVYNLPQVMQLISNKFKLGSLIPEAILFTLNYAFKFDGFLIWKIL